MSIKMFKITEGGQRESAPLKHLDLPDDLFDHEHQEQPTIDAGDYSDSLGIWGGSSMTS